MIPSDENKKYNALRFVTIKINVVSTGNINRHDTSAVLLKMALLNQTP